MPIYVENQNIYIKRKKTPLSYLEPHMYVYYSIMTSFGLLTLRLGDAVDIVSAQ